MSEVATPVVPSRMTLSRVVEMLLTRNAGEKSVVALTRNANGDTQIEVRVGTGNDADVQTVEEAEAKAREVYDRLAAAYSVDRGHDNAEVSLTRNAKGDTQIGVQVKTGDRGIVGLEDAETKALEVYDRMTERYAFTGTAKVSGGES